MAQIISIDLVAAAKRSADIPGEYTHDDIVRAVSQYEKFLTLAAKYKETALIPTKQIDMIWHLHMLNPRDYYHDCMALFGQILDHEAGFGERQSEKAAHAVALDITAALWKKEFGESYLVNSGSDQGDTASCMADVSCRSVASCMADSRCTARIAGPVSTHHFAEGAAAA
ncbi:glycine-rich domain-containing protein-like [Parasphingorhabdus cellanae]|uniref:Glycine-rich domain-containing protein-like n=2 Tax=Parasphingorhabdus cellanae TaxID=2806553 RepID=A0ABX7T4J4_9SPHN|nr:glycine-rich domain-containing protein-like [Parasphingorhabdus cellanae]